MASPLYELVVLLPSPRQVTLLSGDIRSFFRPALSLSLSLSLSLFLCNTALRVVDLGLWQHRRVCTGPFYGCSSCTSARLRTGTRLDRHSFTNACCLLSSTRVACSESSDRHSAVTPSSSPPPLVGLPFSSTLCFCVHDSAQRCPASPQTKNWAY